MLFAHSSRLSFDAVSWLKATRSTSWAKTATYL